VASAFSGLLQYMVFHGSFSSMALFVQSVCDHAQAFLFVKLQNPSKMRKAQAEIDLVLGQGRPTFELLKKLE
jgi:hypothetical protein